MIDHVILNVMDLDASRQFYINTFASLGYDVVWDLAEWVGFGEAGKAKFWIAKRKPLHTKVHVAFTCDKRKVVDQFYEAALKAGGIDNGSPGIRKHYGPNYYSAFVFDLDGNNIEAVCRKED